MQPHLQGLINPKLLRTRDVVSELLSDYLGKPLLRLAADPVEAIRSEAIDIFLQCLRQGPDAILPLLPYAVPILRASAAQRGRPHRAMRRVAAATIAGAWLLHLF